MLQAEIELTASPVAVVEATQSTTHSPLLSSGSPNIGHGELDTQLTLTPLVTGVSKLKDTPTSSRHAVVEHDMSLASLLNNMDIASSILKTQQPQPENMQEAEIDCADNSASPILSQPKTRPISSSYAVTPENCLTLLLKEHKTDTCSSLDNTVELSGAAELSGTAEVAPLKEQSSPMADITVCQPYNNSGTLAGSAALSSYSPNSCLSLVSPSCLEIPESEDTVRSEGTLHLQGTVCPEGTGHSACVESKAEAASNLSTSPGSCVPLDNDASGDEAALTSTIDEIDRQIKCSRRRSAALTSQQGGDCDLAAELRRIMDQQRRLETRKQIGRASCREKV